MIFFTVKPHLTSGQRAEQAARQLIQRCGYRSLAINYQCRFGEIDIIGKKDQLLIFVEVRYRQKEMWGSALESINLSKQAKIIKTADYFLTQHVHLQHHQVRFDVICFQGKIDTATALWVESAF